MKKFINAAALIFLGGVASVNAQSVAGQEDFTTASIMTADLEPRMEMVTTITAMESEELRKKFEHTLNTALEQRIQEKLNSQLTFDIASEG